MEKILRVLLNKWVVSLVVLLVLLFLMPANSPIPLPSVSKVFVAAFGVLIMFSIFTKDEKEKKE